MVTAADIVAREEPMGDEYGGQDYRMDRMAPWDSVCSCLSIPFIL